MRVNGKPPILGTRSPLTPQSIEKKLTPMTTSEVEPHMPKMVKVGHAGPVSHKYVSPVKNPPPGGKLTVLTFLSPY